MSFIPVLTPVAAKRTLIRATFTAANGTSLDAYTPERGGTATEHGGDWSIDTNTAMDTTGVGQDLVSWDAGKANVTLEVDLITPAAGAFDAGVCMRVTDGDNNWIVACTQGSNLRIFQEAATVFTERANGAFTWNNATTYRLKVVCQGTTISAYVDGVLIASYASATFNQSATRFGLRENTPANQCRFDNFRVTG